jgi:hypothetical protein
MRAKTKELLAFVDREHDWDEGEVHGGSGTRLSSTDSCRVCGLVRRWFSDAQNGVSGRYTFDDYSLEEASHIRCCGQEDKADAS